MTESEKKELEIAPEELLLFSNVLNEVCNGFAIQNFNRVIGAPMHEVELLLDRIRAAAERQHSKISFTPAELKILQNALRETLHELGIEEFATRTGVEFAAGEDTLKQLQQYP